MNKKLENSEILESQICEEKISKSTFSYSYLLLHLFTNHKSCSSCLWLWLWFDSIWKCVHSREQIYPLKVTNCVSVPTEERRNVPSLYLSPLFYDSSFFPLQRVQFELSACVLSESNGKDRHGALLSFLKTHRQLPLRHIFTPETWNISKVTVRLLDWDVFVSLHLGCFCAVCLQVSLPVCVIYAWKLLSKVLATSSSENQHQVSASQRKTISAPPAEQKQSTD